MIHYVPKQTQLADTRGKAIPRESSICPQCDKSYVLFPSAGFHGDQSVCQACTDKNFAPTRAIMQGIERHYAEQELQRRLENKPETWGPFVALSGVPA